MSYCHNVKEGSWPPASPPPASPSWSPPLLTVAGATTTLEILCLLGRRRRGFLVFFLSPTMVTAKEVSSGRPAMVVVASQAANLGLLRPDLVPSSANLRGQGTGCCDSWATWWRLGRRGCRPVGLSLRSAHGGSSYSSSSSLSSSSVVPCFRYARTDSGPPHRLQVPSKGHMRRVLWRPDAGGLSTATCRCRRTSPAHALSSV